ncbi:type IV pilus twitching motility protein PilT [Kineococcus aurantiacus]|uniref:Twitching motility protein PilT n=1 Tax=Kineococcus aurantiacus TaxID=37633 RepID=A0A7Y9ARS4_9ACTN|nr:type IV pilus twitching motility protein PilT [Kineococcus aurantiacus]NYD20825.1 twitching motility protein PilT [Kineococcus aurantiacus]
MDNAGRGGQPVEPYVPSNMRAGADGVPTARPNISALLKQLEQDQSQLAPAAPQTVQLAPLPEQTPRHTATVAELAPVAALAPVADEVVHEALVTTGGDQEATRRVRVNDVLLQGLELGASDVHLTSGAHPTARVSGEMAAMEEFPKLTPNVLQEAVYAILTQKQRETFEANLELDFAYQVPGRSRFRVNVYRQRESIGAAFRRIPFEIKPLEELGVPPVVGSFAGLQRGFVLVTGPTGSGKSTTLASIVDLANRTRRDHIMTVEDPIEFLHRHKSCIVNQREVGEDTKSFASALKHVLRQDPDIILVGEMRDLETISVALTAAETGHLVFGTLHTQSAASTIDRVIDVFPPHQQTQIRVQLAGAIQGVVCQTLCKRADGRGRVVATEVMVATPAIRNLIREGKTHQIPTAMQAGAQFGMHTLDQHLADLVRTRQITFEHGLEKCSAADEFRRLTGR